MFQKVNWKSYNWLTEGKNEKNWNCLGVFVGVAMWHHFISQSLFF